MLSLLGAAALLAMLSEAAGSEPPRSSSPPAGERAAADPGRELERLRGLYLAAVEDEAAIDLAMAEISALRARLRPAPGAWTDAALSAYGGAMTTLRAKHGAWPPARLRHLREGLAVLDEVVRRHPRHVEARYLRLMSCYYLPSILGRGDSVREDFAALAELLPGVQSSYPPRLYAGMVSFVLEHGQVDESWRPPLEAALASANE